jgi:uncharacterized RDD family membrane protein YckC
MYPSAPVIPAGDPTAVVGKRIGAAIINGVIVLIALVIVTNLIIDLKREDLPAGVDGTEACDQLQDLGFSFCVSSNDTVFYSEDSAAGTLIIVIPLAVWFLVSALPQGLSGASLGKHLVGLRVIDKNTGRQVSFGKNLLRWIVGIFDAGCCFPVGLIMVLTTKGHRRLGDMAANTLVVNKESVGTPPVVPGLTSPQFTGSPYATSYPPSSPMSPPMPASPTGWPPPSAGTPSAPPPQAAPMTPDVPPPGAPPTSGAPPLPPEASAASNTPTWDPQRNTYVLFDATQNQWVQWDAEGQQWRPLS